MESVCSRTLEKSSDTFDSELILLLGSKVDEVGPHAVLLTTSQLIHTKSLVEQGQRLKYIQLVKL